MDVAIEVILLLKEQGSCQRVLRDVRGKTWIRLHNLSTSGWNAQFSVPYQHTYVGETYTAEERRVILAEISSLGKSRAIVSSVSAPDVRYSTGVRTRILSDVRRNI